MPLIGSKYKAPLWIGGKHAQTIIPSLFRKVSGVVYERERIHTEDDDFLDIDWSCVGSKKLIVLSHGLEGSSRSQYVLGMIKEFNARGWDAIGWNFRSCSGELNRTIRLYHGGSSHDLKSVVEHAQKKHQYKKICVIGFSLGGNITLKYLGDHSDTLLREVKGGCVFSVPCDLYACARNLSHGVNRFYLNRFLTTLKEKMQKKMEQNPGLFSGVNIKQIQDFYDWDNLITAPLLGFKDAMHYYMQASSKYSIPKIRVPTLIVNAQNDPFLHPSCFPFEECHKSETVYFENPYDGGHQGFIKDRIIGTYWSEERALSFLEERT
jgi:uncharacterized protein